MLIAVIFNMLILLKKVLSKTLILNYYNTFIKNKGKNMVERFDIIRFTVSTNGMGAGPHFWKIARNLTKEDAQKEFDEQERLSKMFADGTYHSIVKASTPASI